MKKNHQKRCPNSSQSSFCGNASVILIQLLLSPCNVRLITLQLQCWLVREGKKRLSEENREHFKEFRVLREKESFSTNYVKLKNCRILLNERRAPRRLHSPIILSIHKDFPLLDCLFETNSKCRVNVGVGRQEIAQGTQLNWLYHDYCLLFV